MQSISQQILGFITSNQFWKFHGVGLTAAWLGLSFLGILIKKFLKSGFGLFLHLVIFVITDLTTLFLVGGAFYRVYPKINNFPQWSLLKQGHIGGGILFTILMVIQHIGGMAALCGADGSGHKKFGYVVSTILRIIACCGWLLAKKQEIAIYCGIVTFVQFIIFWSLKQKKHHHHHKAGTQQKQNSRTKKD